MIPLIRFFFFAQCPNISPLLPGEEDKVARKVRTRIERLQEDVGGLPVVTHLESSPYPTQLNLFIREKEKGGYGAKGI